MRYKDYIEIDQTRTQGYIALMAIDGWNKLVQVVLPKLRTMQDIVLTDQHHLYWEYRMRLGQLEFHVSVLNELVHRALQDVTDDTGYDINSDYFLYAHLDRVRKIQQCIHDIFSSMQQIYIIVNINDDVINFHDLHYTARQVDEYVMDIAKRYQIQEQSKAKAIEWFSNTQMMMSYAMLVLPITENDKQSARLPFFLTLKNNSETREILEQFTLFAFVLYDVQTHLDILRALQRRYQTLHEDTGKDFLFFSFFKPSKSWLKQQRSQDGMYAGLWNVSLFEAIKQRKNVKKSLKTIKQIEINQPELHISLVAQQLKISYEQMPCLVVTTSLYQSQEYIIVPFNQQDLSAKLIKLGEIATAYAKTNASSKEFGDTYLLEIVRQELSKTYTDTIVSYVLDPYIDSLIEMLDVSAFTDVSECKIRLERYQEIIQHLRGSLASLADSNLLESDFAQQRMQRLDRYCDVVCRLLAQYAELMSLPSTQNPVPDVDTQLLEADSALFLSTFQRVWSAYQLVYASSSTQLDYSTFTISLTKMIENEINLSIIQVVRQLLGIDFPAWYNRHQQGKHAKVMSGRLEIDFNRFVHQQLVLPGIGQSFNVAKYSSLNESLKQKISTYAQPEISTQDVDALYAQLLAQWELLIPKRNQSAHGTVVDEAAFNEVVQIVTQFREIFRLLACIKQKMRY